MKQMKRAGHFYMELGGPEEKGTKRRGTHTHLVPEILISEDHKSQQQPGIPVGAHKTLSLNYMPRALQFKILATCSMQLKTN